MWVRGVADVWLCSMAAYWGVCLGEYDVREYLPVHHSTCASVCRFIEDDSSVGFDFSYVAYEAFIVPCFGDVISVAEEVFVYVVCVSEGVECVIAKCVNAEGDIGEYLENRFFFVHVYG